MSSTQSTDNQKLAESVKRLLGDCVGYSGDELTDSRKSAYDYYFQRPRGDEIVGRSNVVTGDLSAMVEGNLAMMVQPITAKRIAEFCAYDAQDEEQAQLEGDCVKEMIFDRNNGFIETASAIKDALLLRNCVVKVYVDERTHRSKVRRENVSPEIIPDVLEKIGTVTIHKYDAESRSLSATVEKTTRKFRVESIATENFLFPRNWHRQDLEGIPFCAERHVESRSTLVERGFDKNLVAQIKRWNAPSNNASDSRLPYNLSLSVRVEIDKSQELVEWYECYVMMDDGDGAATLHNIAIADSIILDDDEEVTMVQYATGIAIINPHTFIGISLYDKLKGVQDASTALNRALFDNLNATNKNRVSYLDGVVEEGDITDGRVNGGIRVNPERVQDVRAAVAAFAVQDTTANILMNIEHQRKIRSEMGGATLDMATGQMQLNDRLGSQGLDRAYSVMEQLAQFMTQVIANTLIRQMYIIGHEVLRTQWREPIKFKRGKEWLTVDPSKWAMRENVKINIGKSANERTRIAMVLDSLMQKQILLAQNGMEEILIDVQAFYNALVDWLRINDIEIPERYLLDPRTPQAVEAFKKKHAGMQAAAAKQDALLQQSIGLEQLRTAFEKYKTDAELQFKYYELVINTQVKEAELTTSTVVDLTKARADAKAARERQNADNKADGATPKQLAGPSAGETGS
jgi:hypothetical protein